MIWVHSRNIMIIDTNVNAQYSSLDILHWKLICHNVYWFAYFWLRAVSFSVPLFPDHTCSLSINSLSAQQKQHAKHFRAHRNFPNKSIFFKLNSTSVILLRISNLNSESSFNWATFFLSERLVCKETGFPSWIKVYVYNGKKSGEIIHWISRSLQWIGWQTKLVLFCQLLRKIK